MSGCWTYWTEWTGLYCNCNLRKLKQHNARRVGHRGAWTDSENCSDWEKKLPDKLDCIHGKKHLLAFCFSCTRGRALVELDVPKKISKEWIIMHTNDKNLTTCCDRPLTGGENALLYSKCTMDNGKVRGTGNGDDKPWTQRNKKVGPKKAHGSPFRSAISNLQLRGVMHIQSTLVFCLTLTCPWYLSLGTENMTHEYTNGRSLLAREMSS